MVCENCGSELKRRSQIKYCSNKCQIDFQYKNYIKDWKSNIKSGDRGIVTKTISQHLKRYLMEKYGNRCVLCGWKKKHPITGVVPLEIDHIDGNAENNLEGNLQLICPNCHALTPFFKNLNKGNGRIWRKIKYIKNRLPRRRFLK